MPPPPVGDGPALAYTAFHDAVEGDVVERGYDEVGAGLPQHGDVIEPGDAEAAHSGRFRGLDPGGGVLDHEARAGPHAELFGGGQKDRRVGLPLREIASGDIGVEEFEQRESGPDEVVFEPLFGGEGIQPDLPQEQPRVFR